MGVPAFALLPRNHRLAVADARGRRVNHNAQGAQQGQQRRAQLHHLLLRHRRLNAEQVQQVEHERADDRQQCRQPNLVVEVGLKLPGGVDVVVASQCRYGDTAVYDLLLTIVGSLTDAAPLQTWLEETWIPTVMQE